MDEYEEIVEERKQTITDFRMLPCPYCKKQPGIRKNISERLPMQDPQRYSIRCCIGEAYGISETQVIVNWNKAVLKVKN